LEIILLGIISYNIVNVWNYMWMSQHSVFVKVLAVMMLIQTLSKMYRQEILENNGDIHNNWHKYIIDLI